MPTVSCLKASGSVFQHEGCRVTGLEKERIVQNRGGVAPTLRS